MKRTELHSTPEMDNNRYKIKKCIFQNNKRELMELLDRGLNPNFEGGWPIRLAARYGFYNMVKLLIQYGANPHLLSDSGASTLQLAVYSGEYWNTDKWAFLLSSCDSSQLADGAAVAIIFSNIPALKKIIQTGRCNTHIPTSLTGKTVEDLAKGYKLHNILLLSASQSITDSGPTFLSPVQPRRNMSDFGANLTPQATQRSLSPSVARFFNLTATQTSLTPPRNHVSLVPTVLPFSDL